MWIDTIQLFDLVEIPFSSSYPYGEIQIQSILSHSLARITTVFKPDILAVGLVALNLLGVDKRV